MNKPEAAPADNQTAPVEPAVEQLLANVSQRFESARAMPPSVYTSQDFLALENSRIFAREWVCVGRADQLPETGDYLTTEIAGQPVLVLRDKNGELMARSNVCLHRMSTLLHGYGNTRTITCPYHGWAYNLDGTLRGAAAMDQNQAFCKNHYRLPSFRCEQWLGWIMVSLNPDAMPVAEQLADVEARIADYGVTGYRQTFFETHEWQTNWKILAENFMESYHLPVCHAGTIGGLSRLQDMVCPPGLRHYNYHTILKDDSLPIALAHPDNRRMHGERRRTTFLLAIYPSLLITLTPGYFWYLSLLPGDVGRVRIMFGGGMAPEFIKSDTAHQHLRDLKTLLDEVNVEDRRCTERVFRGLQAEHARPGHLSHLERPNYDFAQYLADRTGGFERRFDEQPA